MGIYWGWNALIGLNLIGFYDLPMPPWCMICSPGGIFFGKLAALRGKPHRG